MMQGSLGRRLRLLRAERGLSLRQAAAKAGVVKETISDIERGYTHPYDVTLAKLARAYDVPVEGLLEEPELIGPKTEAPGTGRPHETPPRVSRARLQEHFDAVRQNEVDYLNNEVIADLWRLAQPGEKPQAHNVPEDIDTDRVWQFLEHALGAGNVFEPEEAERINRGARKRALAG
jgi:transcriptional regulator with XRE-family HTH domain